MYKKNITHISILKREFVKVILKLLVEVPKTLTNAFFDHQKTPERSTCKFGDLYTLSKINAAINSKY